MFPFSYNVSPPPNLYYEMQQNSFDECSDRHIFYSITGDYMKIQKISVSHRRFKSVIISFRNFNVPYRLFIHV